MQKIGYSLINRDSNTEIKFWNEFPEAIFLDNGDVVYSPVLNSNYSNNVILEKYIVSNTELQELKTGETVDIQSDKVVVTYNYRSCTKNELITYASSVRYDKEINGFLVNLDGSNTITVTSNTKYIYTDRSSQATITGIITLMQMFPNTTISYKTGSGFIEEANSATMVYIATKMAEHVQTCFNKEASIINEINSNTITTYEQVRNYFN